MTTRWSINPRPIIIWASEKNCSSFYNKNNIVSGFLKIKTWRLAHESTAQLETRVVGQAGLVTMFKSLFPFTGVDSNWCHLLFNYVSWGTIGHITGCMSTVSEVRNISTSDPTQKQRDWCKKWQEHVSGQRPQKLAITWGSYVAILYYKHFNMISLTMWYYHHLHNASCIILLRPL
jgi:hypothetical protein